MTPDRTILHPTMTTPCMFATYILSLSTLILCTVRTYDMRQPFNLTDLYPKWAERIQSIRTDYPIPNSLREDPAYQPILEKYFQLFEVLHATIQSRIQNQHLKPFNKSHCVQWVIPFLRRALISPLGELCEYFFPSVNMRDAINNDKLPLSGSAHITSARKTIRNAILFMHRAVGKLSLPKYNENWWPKDSPFSIIGFPVVYTALDFARVLEHDVPSLMPD